MAETRNPLVVAMPERGDRLFRPLDRRDGGIMVHPGGVTDSDGNRDISIRRYLYEEGYKRAAELLVGATQGETFPDGLLYPIVFLYRHYLELRLKSLLNSRPWEESSEPSKSPDHKLEPLWEIVKGSVIPRVWPEVQPEPVEAVDNCIKEFQEQDLNSTEFRYPEDRSGCQQTVKNIESVDIANFSEVMTRIANFLDCVDNALWRWMEGNQVAVGTTIADRPPHRSVRGR